jgi:hypothetical protein
MRVLGYWDNSKLDKITKRLQEVKLTTGSKEEEKKGGEEKGRD